MSKKNERAKKLIALDNMIRHQKRNKNGEAKFNKGQLDAAMQVIDGILKIDGVVKA